MADALTSYRKVPGTRRIERSGGRFPSVVQLTDRETADLMQVIKKDARIANRNIWFYFITA